MPAEIFANDGECLAYEKIGTTTSSIGFTAAKVEYKGRIAKAVLITVETAAIRFTMDGSAAVVTATGGGVGHIVDVGQSYVVRGTKSTRNFRCINAVASSGAVVHCSYFF
jgi:hypothetical protein